MFECEECGWKGDEPDEAERIEKIFLDNRLKSKILLVCPECGFPVIDRYHEEFG